MSQSSKSHGRARVRWRKQAARLVGMHCPRDDIRAQVVRDACLTPSGRAQITEAILDGAHFDVHAARALALEMIAMAPEQSVFEDWTRARGLGPENREREAFASCTFCRGCRIVANFDGGPLQPAGVWSGPVKHFEHAGVLEVGLGEACECTCVRRQGPRGGWPGNLAREYADEQTFACCGVDRACFVHNPGPCNACSARYKRHTQAPMGRNIARVGQRLLDTLDGLCPWNESAEPQPSGCWHAQCVDGVQQWHDGPTPCDACRGTGHNLRGFVPEVEWPVIENRKMFLLTMSLLFGVRENWPPLTDPRYRAARQR